jgi:hypothetical protein
VWWVSWWGVVRVCWLLLGLCGLSNVGMISTQNTTQTLASTGGLTARDRACTVLCADTTGCAYHTLPPGRPQFSGARCRLAAGGLWLLLLLELLEVAGVHLQAELRQLQRRQSAQRLHRREQLEAPTAQHPARRIGTTRTLSTVVSKKTVVSKNGRLKRALGGRSAADYTHW